MQVDVGTLADVAGHHAADQPRPKRREGAASSQRLEPHRVEIFRAAVAFVQPGKRLNLVANFGIGGQVGCGFTHRWPIVRAAFILAR